MQRLGFVVVFVLVLLAGCSNRPHSDDRTYIYMDGTGHLVHGVLPANNDGKPNKTAATTKKETASANELEVDGVTYQSAEAAAAKQEARAHDRFVTYFNADGRVIRQRIDPVAAKKHAQQIANQKDYETITHAASQRALDRQYSQTQMAVPADCCRALLPHADPLKLGDDAVLRFEPGSYGWITLSQRHPAHLYELDEKAQRLRVISYKQNGHYLHPFLLFLNQQGTPVMAVNNFFQRRYSETWFRYSYVEGDLPIPDNAHFAVLYLPYEGGGPKVGMQPVMAVNLLAEKDAKPTKKGELVVSVH